ncbi:hypothetical protein QR680_011167 [Steinernema hermaphroditum]|uniref:Uncharacterized protein n=1 Tax=Steinernema hermaphroditum TaxID=289476 RepID=A0AA39MCW4_9BILA|nr:hypothetical protein QR680_011167 [Steinernema hermaphroditum]
MACVVKRERCVERKTVVPKSEWPQREEKCRAKGCWSYGAITGFISPMVKKEDMERDLERFSERIKAYPKYTTKVEEEKEEPTEMERVAGDCTDHRPEDATKAHKQEHKKVVVEWELLSSDDSSDSCSRLDSAEEDAFLLKLDETLAAKKLKKRTLESQKDAAD